MKKRKITYSLTARQKRELNEPKPTPAPEVEETVSRRKPNIRVIICICAVVLAAILIVFAICIPIWVNNENITNDTFLNWKYYNPNDPNNPYSADNPNPNEPANPLATIVVTGDNKEAFSALFGKESVDLEFEIFMDDAPYSGMNFMYLAESGFYDGTIISDINNRHAMFSGFTEAKDSANRALELSFIRNLKGFTEHNISSSGTSGTNVNNLFKLGYRLSAEKKRSTAGTSSGSMGYLVMIAGSGSYSSSNSFMMLTGEDPQLTFANTGSDLTSSYLSWMGKSNNEETNSFLRKLNEVETTLNGKFYVPQTTIRISSIRTNLTTARKNYLLNNYESLISNGKSTWRNYAYGSDYYTFGK